MEENKKNKIPNVPNLRFSFEGEYVEYCIGDLIVQKGKRAKGQELKYKAYSINNQTGFSIQEEQWGEASYTKLEKNGYKVIEKNDLAYNPARINVGSIGLYKQQTPCIVSSLYVCFTTKPKLSPDYLFKYLKSDKFNRKVLSTQEGGVRTYFFYDKLQKTKMFVPTISEQIKVNAFLDCINEKIETQNKIIEDNKILKKAIYNAIFGSLKYDTVMHPISDFLTLSRCSREIQPNREKLITVKLNERGVVKNENTETLKINATVYYKRQAGQFIYGKQNLFHGAIGIVPKELDGYLSSNDVPTLDFKEKNTADLVLRSISYSCYSWEKYASGTGSKRIHENQLLNCQIPYPGKKYVASIMSLLCLIDKRIENENQLLVYYNRQKSYLLNNLFI